MNLYKSQLAAVAALIALIGAAPANADTDQAAKLLPSSTILFAELKGVDGLIEMVLEHPLRAKIESLDEVKKGYESKEFLQFRSVVSLVEGNLGMSWREAAEQMTQGGAYAAFDAKTDGVVLLLKAANEELPEKAIETFLNFARADALGKDKKDPIKKTTYRDLKAYSVDKNKFVRFGQWLLITNKGELAKAVVDQHLDGGDDCLASNARFQQAVAARPKSAQLWGYVDIKTIRESGEAEEFYRERADNPGVEMLAGGILSTLRETPYATFQLELQAERIAAALATPHDPEWTPERRNFYFGPEGKGRAPAIVQVDDTLFTLSTYRDFGEMWMRAGDLFDEKVNDEMAKAEANLSTLFSGKDFGEDILGAMRPEMQLIVTKQDFDGVLPQPSIKLPSFAIVARLKDPEKMRTELRRTFQSLIGFLNVVGAMQGQPQLDLDMDKDGDKLIVSSSYAPEDDEKESKDARINFNFSPSVAFKGDVFVLSSTTQLANQLADAANLQIEPSADNTSVVADVAGIRAVLDANREHLIAQNMLEEGHSREEAEQAIGVLMEILKVVQGASMRLTPADDALQLSLEVRLSEDVK